MGGKATKQIENLVLFIIVFLVLLGGWVYFVGGITSVAPPVKQYLSNANISSSLEEFRRYENTHARTNFRISDTTENENEYAIYAIVNIIRDKHNLEFHLKFEENKSDEKTIIAVTSVFDKSAHTGGYNIKYPEVKELVTVFEKLVWKEIAL